MTARDIQRRLISERYARSFVLYNYTPSKWWECDVFEITKAGYFREYEIKLTRADFFADSDKHKRRWDWQAKADNITNKHDQLRIRSTFGPVQFWFVCPEGLIQAQELPEWAGLMYARKYHGRVFVSEAKRAPKLHREKVNADIERHARGVCYWRMHRLFVKQTLIEDPNHEHQITETSTNPPCPGHQPEPMDTQLLS